jgi:hypothetical protein
LGGGQIGYNWQFSPILVVGLEADFQGTLEKDSNTFTENFSTTINIGIPASFVGFTVLDCQTKIDWFGTVRPRIGYVWGNGQVMTYVTGGLPRPSITGPVGTSAAVTGALKSVLALPKLAPAFNLRQSRY